MEYRKLPKGGEQISILGLGNSSMGASGEKEAEAAVTMAVENGINYFDMAAADAVPFAPFGRAVEGCRDKVYFQVHFGAEYRTGTYGWTLNLEKIKRSVDWQLEMLKTDYIDFGFIHCIDEAADLEKVISGGTLDYMKELKAFSAGQLLNAKTSPFKQALTEYQCIQYALDKPGVVTVLPGVRGREDLKRILGFLDAAPEEKDYSVLGSFAPQDAEGICVYCNHCQPCPAGLDVGLINKYYDLAQAGDVSAAAQLLLAVWRSPYDEKITNRLMQASLQRLLMIFSPHGELFGKEYKEISRQIFFDMISLGIGKIGIRGYGKSEIM